MTTKTRLSGEQLSQQLLDILESVKYNNGILLALVPQDYTVEVGQNKISRSQLKDNSKNVERALKTIASQVKRGVRRRVPSDNTEGSDKPKRHGGLDKPNYYNKELIEMFLNADLGTVDPLNPKSEKITDVLKRSVFGKKCIATPHTFSRLFSILVKVNNFQDKEKGQFIRFPEGFLKKHLPTITDVLSKSGFDTSAITWINLGKFSSAAIVNKTVLTEPQLAELDKHTEIARDTEYLAKQVLLRHNKKDGVPAPVVPVSIAGTTASSSKLSPKKK